MSWSTAQPISSEVVLARNNSVEEETYWVWWQHRIHAPLFYTLEHPPAPSPGPTAVAHCCSVALIWLRLLCTLWPQLQVWVPHFPNLFKMNPCYFIRDSTWHLCFYLHNDFLALANGTVHVTSPWQTDRCLSMGDHVGGNVLGCWYRSSHLEAGHRG